MSTEWTFAFSNHNTPHCSSCGKENPETDEGYTLCCRKPVCDGWTELTFVSRYETEEVEACCWAKANEKWMQKYGHRPPAFSHVKPHSHMRSHQ